MTNPTLIAQDTPWRGFTGDTILERLLKSRGLTADSTSGSTLATTSETLAAKTHLSRAFDLCNADFPSLFTTQRYSVAWVAGDDSIALPSNIMAVLNVTWGGVYLRPLNRVDYSRYLRSDDEGGDIGPSADPTHFRISGHSDEDVGTSGGDRDWRIVLQLHPAPAATLTDTLEVEYLALAKDHFVDATVSADPLPLFPWLQGWVLERAKELWAAENGDSAIASVAEKERAKHERSIERWIDGVRPPNTTMKWQYPVNRGRRGGRYR